jgi:hypothetical protein
LLGDICGERMRFEPQRARRNRRIHTDPVPPGSFVTTMKLPMMTAAQRHRELIADLASECAALCKTQVMRI